MSSLKHLVEKIFGKALMLYVRRTKRKLRISFRRFIRAFFQKKEAFPYTNQIVLKLPKQHLFFGYYDVQQFSNSERLLLATVVRDKKVLFSKHPDMKIGFLNLDENQPNFHEVATTKTWCWQQGCRLQWYPDDEGRTIIYNCIVEGIYGCVLQNVFNRKIIKKYKRPIYVISKNGNWGLSVNFSRLQRLRPGYGYNLIPDETENENIPKNDGVWRIDMRTGDEKMLFSIKNIYDLIDMSKDKKGEYYINHLLFNPDSSRFMFLLICRLFDGARKIRLVTCSINGDDMRFLNNSEYVSHYCWLDNKKLLCFLNIAGLGEGYYLYDDLTGNVEQVGGGVLKDDGHPTYIKGGSYIITDTYPDEFGEQSLLLYRNHDKVLKIIDKISGPITIKNENRCDLHPRVSPSGKYVCVDFILKHRRAMKVFNIKDLFN